MVGDQVTWPAIGCHRFVIGWSKYMLRNASVEMHSLLTWPVGIPTVFHRTLTVPLHGPTTHKCLLCKETLKESNLSQQRSVTYTIRMLLLLTRYFRKLKFYKNLFAHNLRFKCPIILKFSKESSSITAVLHAKFHNNKTIKKVLMDYILDVIQKLDLWYVS